MYFKKNIVKMKLRRSFSLKFFFYFFYFTNYQEAKNLGQLFCLFALSTNSHCGANSMPKGTPNLGCCKERNFVECKQLNCDTAWLWNSSIVSQLSYGTAGLWSKKAGKLGGGPQARWLSSYIALSWSSETISMFQLQLGKNNL